MTGGRGPDSVLDAVGMEAHGSPATTFVQKAAGLLPRAVAAPLMEKAGVDRLNALYSAIDIVRRGGTISLTGVYGGAADPIPMLTLFDKQIQLRMGQANIKRWIPDIMPLLTDDDPLGCDTFATHRVPLSRGAGDVQQVPEEGRRRREGAAQAGAVTHRGGTAERRPSPGDGGTAWPCRSISPRTSASCRSGCTSSPPTSCGPPRTSTTSGRTSRGRCCRRPRRSGSTRSTSSPPSGSTSPASASRSPWKSCSGVTPASAWRSSGRRWPPPR